MLLCDFSDFGKAKYAELRDATATNDLDRTVHLLSEMSLEGSDFDAAFVDEVVTNHLAPEVAARVRRRPL